VRRRRSRADRHAFALELTPEGEALYAKVVATRSALIARVERCLDAQGRAAFQRIAEKLHGAFPEANASAGAGAGQNGKRLTGISKS
jgi:DNA-binding MarR family transcriptional regulator